MYEAGYCKFQEEEQAMTPHILIIDISQHAKTNIIQGSDKRQMVSNAFRRSVSSDKESHYLLVYHKSKKQD